MTRILLIYYSQSGEAARIVEALTASLHAPEVELAVERLRPKQDYPFPWRSIGRFFDVLPECHLGPFPELEPLRFDADQRFDLVILIYQVWFLMPSLPVQSFLQSQAARVLRDTKLMTIVVSRNMWHSAAETMKVLLASAGARHIDNIAVTHQGPAWATFITTPRLLLFGRRTRSRGGVADADLDRIRCIGANIQRWCSEPEATNEPRLAPSAAAPISRRYLLPDLLGWYLFRGWAYFLKFLSRLGTMPRRAGIYLFVAWLIFAVLLLIPLSMIVRLLLYPILNPRLEAYSRRLQEPRFWSAV
jgi:hypothetical protein